MTRAGSPGTESRSRARSLVLLTMLAPLSRSAQLGDQPQLEDESNPLPSDFRPPNPQTFSARDARRAQA